MPFENPQLDISDLPDYRLSAYSSLEITYLAVMRWGAVIFAMITLALPIIALTVWEAWSDILPLSITFGIWILFNGINLMLIPFKFRHKGYAIRERDISYKSGLLNRTIITIPFNRVQHCDIKQGLISRYFGLAKLNVYTAGGSKSDVAIPGLRPQVANRILEFVLQKTLEYDEEE